MLMRHITFRSLPAMPTAFVLLSTEMGFESDVLKTLKKVEGVDETSVVYGVYDVVARVKTETMDKLKEIITCRIRRLDKVKSTLTMIVVEAR
jgi:DNA-binding Lrp family transcriptional regulator